MTKVIGVRFRNVNKLYYFDAKGIALGLGDKIIVETSRGQECGEVGMAEREMEDALIVKPLKSILRKATPQDLEQHQANKEKEKNAYELCQAKISEHKLDMKLVDVEYTFDGQKITFYFTAESRVDFRTLVKDLASVFRTRIELRQIGVRDESKILGGVGTCGQSFCCSTFLFDFQPVSIKMAKEQGKSLNPNKISGTCGRLLCCLKYEQDNYEELGKNIPRNGVRVSTPDGEGTVIDSAVLAQKIKVRLDSTPDAPIRDYKIENIKPVSGGRQEQNLPNGAKKK